MFQVLGPLRLGVKAVLAMPGLNAPVHFSFAFILQTYTVSNKEVLLINYSDLNSDSDSLIHLAGVNIKM